MRRARWTGAASVCTLSVALLSSQAPAQGPLVTIHVTVERPQAAPPATREVRANEWSKKGIPAVVFAPWVPESGLSREDFEVIADSVVAPITACEPASGPLWLVLVVDASASMESAVRATWLPDVVPEVAARAARLGDRVAIARVGGGETRVTAGFSSDVAAATKSARDILKPTDRDKSSLLAGLDPSPIWDAVDRSISLLEDVPGRHAIVLFTDGRSSANAHGLADVATHAVSAGVSVSVVSTAVEEMIRQSGPMAARVRPAAALESMTTSTGGTFIQAWQPLVMGALRLPQDEGWLKRSMTNVLTRMVEERHGGYLLTFPSAAADGLLHPLKVRVTKPGLRVRAPSGYLAQRAGADRLRQGYGGPPKRSAKAEAPAYIQR